MGDLFDIRIVGPSPSDPTLIRAELTKVAGVPDPEPDPEPILKTDFFLEEHYLSFEKGYRRWHEFPDGSYLVLIEAGEEITISRNTDDGREGADGWQFFPSRAGLETRLQSFDPANYGNRSEFYFEPANPVYPSDGDSLVLVESDQAPGTRPQLGHAWAVVFTTSRKRFDEAVERNIRPPYIAPESVLDLDPLPMPEAVFDILPETPDPIEFFEGIHGPGLYLDHVSGWLGRYTHPSGTMPDYGREIAAQMGDLLGLVLTKFDEKTREMLWTRFQQIAQDLAGCYSRGTRWGADGGHGNGRMIPVLTARTLTSTQIKDFSEAQQTFLDGDERPEWRIRPGKEDPDWQAPYRQCCTFCALSTHVLAPKYWTALRDRIAPSVFKAFIGYGTLYANKPDNAFDNSRFRFWTPFARALWQRYA